MKIAVRSDIGRIRQRNEDRGYGEVRESGLAVAILADGMGGHQAGDVASTLAVDTVLGALEGAGGPLSVDERKMLIRQAVLEANEVVYDTASRNEQYLDMGTTIVVALMQEEDGVIGHIGDSRAYKWREGVLSQLTADHTFVNELVRSGQITAEEAAHHPRRNVITRALGTDPQVEVDIRGVPWSEGDLLLLCSDGLTDMVSDAEISDTLGSSELDVEGKADKLVSLALEAGGDDNITVVLLHREGGAEHEE